MSFTWRSLIAPALLAIVTVMASLIAWFQHSLPLVLIALLGSGSIGVALAMQSSTWTTLRIGYYHIAVWFLEGLIAAAFAIAICLSYNEIAGTDKTPLHIAQIAAGVFSGPMVGPIANPGAGANDYAAGVTTVLLGLIGVAASPFVFVRRPVPKVIAVLAWMGFLGTTVLWFLAALLSLVSFLS